MECGLSRTRDYDPILVPPTRAGGHYRNGRVGGPNVWKDISPSVLVPCCGWRIGTCRTITSQPFAAQGFSRVSMWPILLMPLTAAVRTLNMPNVISSSRDLALAALCYMRVAFLTTRLPRRLFRANALRLSLSSRCCLPRFLPSFF